MARELKMHPEIDMTEGQHGLDIPATILEARGRTLHRYYAQYSIFHVESSISYYIGFKVRLHYQCWILQ